MDQSTYLQWPNQPFLYSLWYTVLYVRFLERYKTSLTSHHVAGWAKTDKEARRGAYLKWYSKLKKGESSVHRRMRMNWKDILITGLWRSGGVNKGSGTGRVPFKSGNRKLVAFVHPQKKLCSSLGQDLKGTPLYLIHAPINKVQVPEASTLVTRYFRYNFCTFLLTVWQQHFFCQCDNSKVSRSVGCKLCFCPRDLVWQLYLL